MRTCGVCGKEKPEEYFERDRQRKSGYSNRCKSCASRRVAARQRQRRERERRERAAAGVVYVVRAVGTEFFKVGTALNVEERVRELQCGSPFELCVEGTFEGGRVEEAELQRRLRSFHVRGEWYLLPSREPDVMAWLRGISALPSVQ